MGQPQITETNGETYSLGDQGDSNFAILADNVNSNTFYVSGSRVYALRDSSSVNADTYSVICLKGVVASGSAAYSYWTYAPGSTSSTAVHADSRSLSFAENGQMIMTNDGGIYFKDRSVPKGDWGVLNGNLAIGEIVSVGYDSAADVLTVGAQDNGSQMSFMGAMKKTGLFVLVAGGDGGYSTVDPLDLDAAGTSARHYVASQTLGSFFGKCATEHAFACA